MLQILSSIAEIERSFFIVQSILEALYYGHLCPSEKPPAPGSDTEKDQAACYDFALQLEQTLNGKEKALFESFAEANQAFCERSCCKYFCDGFRFGARMMLEVMQGDITLPLPPEGRPV